MRKAALLPFVFVMYVYATGGPFGLEDMVTTSGPGLTLLYQLFIPLFWCIPVSLVVAELTTAIPVEGGFYRWVRAAFGDFWGFQAGWWNWSASFLLAAAYAVLTTDYLSFYFPAIVGWKHHLVSVLIIAVIAWINVRGIQMVGAVSTVLEIFVLLVVFCRSKSSAPGWRSACGSTRVTNKCPVSRRKWKTRSGTIRLRWLSSCRSRWPRIFCRQCSRSPLSAIGKNGTRDIFPSRRRCLEARGWDLR